MRDRAIARAARQSLFSVIAGVALLLAGPGLAGPPRGQAAIVTADLRATDAAAEILSAGGNAIDAAIAAELVLGLVEPQSSGLGGGAFLLSSAPGRKVPVVYDGRETAPKNLPRDVFLLPDGKVEPFWQSVESGHSTGVPGLIAMLAEAHKREGRLPWARLFDPAIRLAEDGFVLSPRLFKLLTWIAPISSLDERQPSAGYFYVSPGVPKPIGTVLRNPDYANTLRMIAKNGPKAFYRGEIASQIVAGVRSKERPGTLSLRDLKSYKPIVREALCVVAYAKRICTVPPPSSAIAVLQTVMMVETGPERAPVPPLAARWRLLLDAERLAYADRDYYIADPDFVDMPITDLLDRRYITHRQTWLYERLLRAPTGDPGMVARGKSSYGRFADDNTLEVAGTTHMSIIDAEGHAVAMTATIEAGFGSQTMVAGFMLNNQLTDFTRAHAKDGKPYANAPEGGKRPRSSMSPTIVFDEAGDVFMVTGSPGGSSIIGYVAKSLIGVLGWGLTAQQAVDLPNLIGRGDKVSVEAGRTPEGLITELRKAGMTLAPSSAEDSGLHVIVVRDAGYEFGVDPRREGAEAVVSLGQ